MNRILLVVFAVAAFACASHRAVREDFLLVPGRKPPRDARVSPIASVHQGGNLCAQEVSYKGHQFNIDRTCGQPKITYVQSFDESFATPEGVSVGDPIAKATSAGGVLHQRECEVVLPSRWTAHGTGRDCSTAKIVYLDLSRDGA
jgi:hypothetical protein